MNQEEDGVANSIVSKKQSPVSFQPKNASQDGEPHDAISESLSMLNDQLDDLGDDAYNHQSQKHALMESLKAGELLLNFGLDDDRMIRNDEGMEDEFAVNQVMFNQNFENEDFNQ